MPLHSSLARRTIKSNTGCALPGEADMAFSTSMVADWCSICSPYSLLRSASAAVRACNSRYVSALPMAITACSAKVFSSSIWLSEKPPGSGEFSDDCADRRASRSNGTPIL